MVLREQHRKSIALQQSDTSLMRRHKKAAPVGGWWWARLLAVASRCVPAVAERCRGAGCPDSRPRPAAW